MGHGGADGISMEEMAVVRGWWGKRQEEGDGEEQVGGTLWVGGGMQEIRNSDVLQSGVRRMISASSDFNK